MDESIVCECGNDRFWWFGEFLRCPKCHNEFKGGRNELWMRRFNLETKSYGENWEHL